MAKIILDTNAYTSFTSGDSSVFDEIAGADTVYLPLFVIGELHYGFQGGNRLKKNKELLNMFLAKPTVELWLPTAETAQIYGEIQINLKHSGTPIPVNDIWIASSCVETGSTLITYDKHWL